MEIRQLQPFVQAAQLESFSKTAEMFASEIALLQISITSYLDNESKFFFEKRFANSANESTRS